MFIPFTFLKIVFFFLSECLCVYVHMCASALIGQKRASGFLEQELQMVVSHWMWVLRTELRVISSGLTPFICSMMIDMWECTSAVLFFSFLLTGFSHVFSMGNGWSHFVFSLFYCVSIHALQRLLHWIINTDKYDKYDSVVWKVLALLGILTLRSINRKLLTAH